ncbi:unnamed protein product [Heterobilharzia americana]|nr:unnamed protein product [Heterobilharzia americana]
MPLKVIIAAPTNMLTEVFLQRNRSEKAIFYFDIVTVCRFFSLHLNEITIILYDSMKHSLVGKQFSKQLDFALKFPSS